MHTHSFLPAPFCRAAQGSAIFPIERFVGGGGGGAILPRSTGVARHWPARLRLRSTGAAPYWLGRLPSESVVTGAGECADGLRNARRGKRDAITNVAFPRCARGSVVTPLLLHSDETGHRANPVRRFNRIRRVACDSV